MRRNLIVTSLLLMFYFGSTSCANKNEASVSKTDTTKSAVVSGTEKGVIYLTEETFKTEIFDYTVKKEWSYNGKVPAILDFYADWCGPCKMIAPLLNDIQKEYGGKVQVYKIDTEEQRNLAAMFGIQSLPTIVFVPVNEQPQAVLGYKPRAELDKMILEILKVQK